VEKPNNDIKSYLQNISCVISHKECNEKPVRVSRSLP
jgi:hypothetical protein